MRISSKRWVFIINLRKEDNYVISMRNNSDNILTNYQYFMKMLWKEIKIIGVKDVLSMFFRDNMKLSRYVKL